MIHARLSNRRRRGCRGVLLGSRGGRRPRRSSYACTPRTGGREQQQRDQFGAAVQQERKQIRSDGRSSAAATAKRAGFFGGAFTARSSVWLLAPSPQCREGADKAASGGFIRSAKCPGAQSAATRLNSRRRCSPLSEATTTAPIRPVSKAAAIPSTRRTT